MIPQSSNIISKTGLPCPKSGIWESMGNFKTTCSISKGTKMPDYCGENTNMRLVIEC